eukprot:CAMPEP_0174745586 /NCGR_PEP_ID=MMETSP1094-20130205/87117_1 /TAXON_ID=156173 /ORGANISM="Chrysochromulina brevifilum, Strain UTEX LB 985" /LENGTH=158 /DNA_ID=CAMNT_0015950159 /DNA_START=35 /DNA_END=511 /DNA_ORIENTATION=+
MAKKMRDRGNRMAAEMADSASSSAELGRSASLRMKASIKLRMAPSAPDMLAKATPIMSIPFPSSGESDCFLPLKTTSFTPSMTTAHTIAKMHAQPDHVRRLLSSNRDITTSVTSCTAVLRMPTSAGVVKANANMEMAVIMMSRNEGMHNSRKNVFVPR